MEYTELKARLRQAYDADADSRAVMSDRPWKALERNRFADRLRESGASRLLEIGAGHGISGRFFADQGFDVTCVDLSPELVAHCRGKGLEAQVMDFGDLDFEDASFDAVFGMNCLLHVPKSELPGVLAEVRRVLAPEGLFYWGQYGGQDYEGVWETDHCVPKRFFSFFTADRIEAVADEHFDLVEANHTALESDIDQYQGLILRKR
ncbi:class I SAM-dependent methyltransferase [Glycomyces luteolus]|uniref:Class I SAM-dependent methyltransferase n=1 Tax=Glycomyces luteolus TaxID=2670330 RepID=A0A9X3P833_9ACTN|nr:class I SAM-dependent methyltransferase [Glycomyces luteolus]MDA1360022.1 class I SAM-dependent methyltransferase [Glycomyces luteolus]